MNTCESQKKTQILEELLTRFENRLSRMNDNVIRTNMKVRLISGFEECNKEKIGSDRVSRTGVVGRFEDHLDDFDTFLGLMEMTNNELDELV